MGAIVRTKKYEVLRRMIIMVLIICMLLPQTLVFASDQEAQDLEQLSIPEEILENDLFYIATASQVLNEGEGGKYLLKIGRGGQALDDANVQVKITDITAKYAKDYRINLKGASLIGGDRVKNPEENQSMLEMISGAEDLRETSADPDEEMVEEMLEAAGNDEESVFSAVYGKQEEEIILTAETTPDAIESDSQDATVPEAVYSAVYEQGAIDPLLRGKEMFTGIKSDRKPMSAKKDMLDGMSELANYLTGNLVGATLNVPFKSGEKERYLEIEVLDNKVSDGQRIFAVVLGAASEGMNNSSLSSAMFTIEDDEPKVLSQVHFDQKIIYAEEDRAVVEIYREGSLNSIASVHMKTVAVDAVAGRDYSPVDADVIFPIGIEKRTLEIPVNSQYINDSAQFKLVLEDAKQCVINGDGEAVVNIEKGRVSRIALRAASNNASNTNTSDVTKGANLDLTKMEPFRNTSNFGGKNGYNGDKYSIGWEYSSFWHEWIGTSTARILLMDQNTISAIEDWGDSISYDRAFLGNEYLDGRNDWDGVEIEWEQNSGKPAFVATRVRSINHAGEKTSLFDTEEERWSKRTNTLYFGQEKVIQLEVENQKRKTGNSATANIYRITPIKRKFDVHFKAAAPLTFDDGNGNKIPIPEYTAAELKGANDSGIVEKYADEQFSIAVKNTAKARLKEIRIVTDDNSKVIYTVRPGQTVVNIKIDNLFLQKYKDVILYNDVSGVTGSKKGSFTVQPVFEYINADVRISKAQEGYFDKFNPPSGRQYVDKVYHLGDKLKLKLMPFSPEDYRAASVRYKTKENKNQNKEDSGTYDVTSEDTYIYPINTPVVQLTPVFQKKDNKIVVRINKNDISKYFTANSGVLNYKNRTDGGSYWQYVIDTNPKFQSNYVLTIQPKSSQYVPTWKEAKNDTVYSGNIFYFSAKTLTSENIIWLSAEDTEKVKAGYFSLNGIAYHNNTSIRNKYGAQPYLPAEGAAIASCGNMALVGADGKFELSPFRGVYGGTVRYLVASDGREGLREYTLPTREGTKKEFTTTIFDPETNQTKTQKVQAETVNLSEVVLPSDGTDIPEFISINVTAGNQPIAAYDNAVTINQQTVNFVVNIDPKDQEVVGVDFIVLDKDNKKKFTKEGARLYQGTNIFGCMSMLTTAGDEGYAPGDKLFVQMEINTPPVSQEEGAGQFTTTKLMATDTGLVFVSDTYKEPVTQNFTVPTNASFIELPLIGSFNSAFAFSNVLFTITQKPNNLMELRFGYVPMDISMSADTFKDYGAMPTLDGFKEALGDLSNAKNYKGAVAAMGAPQFKVSPAVGLSLTFGIRDTGDFELMGGGVFLGVTAAFKVTWYTLLPVVYIPCYIGIAGNISALLEGGFTADPTGPLITVGGLNNQSYELDKSMKFDASLQALGNISIFAGVGMAGTIGVRGGGQMDAAYIWYPTVTKDYPDYHTHGLRLTFSLRLWLDAYLMSIPIPIHTFDDLNFGYYEDLANAKEPKTLKTQNALATPGDEDGVQYKDRDYIDEMSEWLPQNNKLYSMRLFSAAEGLKQTTLIESGYDRPDSKLMDIGGGKMLLVFLADDKARESNQRTALQYSIFDGSNWSQPVTIQDDGTADFTPNIMDAGENVIITWISTPPGAVTSDDPKEFLKKTEIYTAMFNKNNGTIGNIVRLTEDDFYDSMPNAIYDETTGDISVYYVKSSVNNESDFVTAVDVTENNSVIVYMLYDGAQGRWLTDYYYDNELSDPADAEILIEKFKGQRFLGSPIEKYGMMDPIITDFNAISYDGTGVYAYTIDKDNIKDTSSDRELFFQVYDFDTHKTYWPVGITDNVKNDAIPKLIRKGNETYLFWLQGDTTLRYVNITALLEEGINPDGSIKEGYDMKIGTVTLLSEYTDNQPILNGYEVVQDPNNNIYVVWAQPVVDEETGKGSQEIFAAAMIETKTAEGEETVVWSQECQVTESGLFNDELSIAVNQSGKVYVVHNEFDQQYTDNADAPVLIEDMKLRVTEFMPDSNLIFEKFIMSDKTPNSGEMVMVGMDIKNEGLLPVVKGYHADIYEVKNGVRGKLVAVIDSDQAILAGHEEKGIFEWTLPEDINNLSLEAVITDKDTNRITSGSSEEIQMVSEYEIKDMQCYQDEEGMKTSFNIVNTGNMASVEDDIVRVNFNGPFVSSDALGIDNKVYYEAEVGTILPGESKAFEGKLDVPGKAFNRFGFLKTYTVVTDSAVEQEKGKGISTDVFTTQPLEISLQGAAEDGLTIEKGESLRLTLSYEPASIYPDADIEYTVQDTSVIAIEGDVIKGIRNGQTVLTAYIQPYGAKKTFDVRVEGGSSSDDDGDDDVVSPTAPANDAIAIDKEFAEQNTTEQVLRISETNGAQALELSIGEDAIGDSTDAIQISTLNADVVLLRDTVEAIRNTGTDAVLMISEQGQQGISVKIMTDDDEQVPVEGYVLMNYDLDEGSLADHIIIKYKDQIITQGFYDEDKGKLYIPLIGSGEYQILENPKSFSDVQAHWASRNIGFLAARFILNGYEDGSFKPEKPVTRAEFLKILQVSDILNTEAEGQAHFSDVDANSWYYDYVRWGAANNIVNGYEDQTFGPEKPITREEMAVMLSKFIALSQKEFEERDGSDFEDDRQIASWAKDAVEMLRRQSIVEGDEENMFNPEDQLTRAQAAKLITVILKRYNEIASR